MALEDIRAQIDETDDEIVKLLVKRMGLSAEIAKSKAETGMDVLDKARERSILQRVRTDAGADERYVNSIYNTIFAASRSYQAKLLDRPSEIGEIVRRGLSASPDVFPQTGMIACQGVEGGYSQMAADRMFPRGNLMYCNSFEAVFSAVDSGLCQFGILPIENSSNGSVRAVYELIREREAYIVRSERLFVHHELLAKPGAKLGDIKEIVSHEQALGQCSEYLAGLGDVTLTRCPNTAEAVKEIAESGRADVAAIASHQCGDLYGLVPLATDVQNSDNNYTRFICIAKDPIIYPGANRISLILTCKHQPGALYEVLGTFASMGVNLMKLESLPIIGHDFEFMFFFDLEASVREEGVVEMLGDLERNTETLVFLGNYSEM